MIKVRNIDMGTGSSMPVVIIVGLRRSGTTAFWEAFRQDSRLCCYDEPFNPNLADLPEENSKGTRKEFINLYKSEPETFKKYFSAIPVSEETEPGIAKEQESYLRWLVTQSLDKEALAIGSVRLSFKLAKLHSILPNSILVHLHRHPIAWVSSHMLPSGKGTWRKPLANIYRKFSFWFRRGFYNNWGYQEIIESEISNHSYWAQADFHAASLKEEPAYVRLASFWLWAFNESEAPLCANVNETFSPRGRELWGDRFFSVSFEDFCLNPVDVLIEIYNKAGLKMPDLDYSYLRAANQGFRPESKRWQRVSGVISSQTITDE